ncbi:MULTISPECIES: VanZ family protein [unclassified Solwaraspora]|uniref:VanZ family protein n=1 Tax=unclassified Solwaraspora TaxID=2627926 RepID=UPI00248B91DE|nr:MULTISPECIES: VanZ family protein [unclassified Solwaraspora]WBB96935.1 VanZ family protein [Solwaraspora sp. WMMA2059]WBC19161.1 VanZ family protein [Solwaraspora sp. WMMA2080]WJK33424.1 VanZ family protein [Solwaraspora sp. WMMA2065]
MLGWAREFLSQPWPFLTLAALAGVSLLAHRPLAVRLGWARWPTLGMLLGAAAIAALTLPPAPTGSGVPLAPGVSVSGPDGEVFAACLRSLTDPAVLWSGLVTVDSLGERVGNVAMFVPLAFCTVLAVRRPALATGLLLLAPVVVEVGQAVLGVGRECVGYDWVNNATGVLIGAVGGGVVRLLWRRFAPSPTKVS